jgi:cytochrome b
MGNLTMAEPTPRKIRIWDLPTRVFHWALVLLVLLSYLTGEIGGFDFTMPGSGNMVANMNIHVWSGLTILTLLVFRIIWGVMGSTTARFSSFIKGPGAIIDYVGGVARRSVKFAAGHNPAGGAVVILMLILLLAQASTGLFAKEDDFFGIAGPLNGLVSEETANQITGIHARIWGIIELVVLAHILANFFYWLVLKHNLIVPMFTGNAEAPADAQVPVLKFASTALALAVLAVAAGIVFWIKSIGG